MEILIIGLGSIANRHISSINSLLNGAVIYALRSSKKMFNIDGVINIYSLNEIPKTIDFAIISNPTHLHAEIILELAKKSIPMMIEKPSIHTLDNSTAIVELIKKSNLFTYVACNLRFHPCLQYLHSYIQDKKLEILDVNVYCGSYLPNWRPNVNFREVYSANLAMGGGVHLDLIHELDYTIWLFGNPSNYRIFTSSKSSLNIDAPDYANYLLEYPSFNVSIVLNYFRIDTKRSIEIVMENKTIIVDLVKNKVLDNNDQLLFDNSNFNVQETYTAQMKYFIEKLKSKEKPMNTFEDSLEVLKIALNYG